MSFGLYLFFTFVMFLFFGLWLRSLVVRRLKPSRLLGDIQEELNALMSDLNTAGDRHVTLLEDRINTLQRLITDADQQVDTLRQVVTYIQEDLAREVRGAQPQENASLKNEPDGDHVSAAPEDSRTDSNDVTDSREPPEQPEPPEPYETAVETVQRLADFGLPSELIAQQTGIAIGEVELIISLQKGHSWR